MANNQYTLIKNTRRPYTLDEIDTVLNSGDTVTLESI